jgi:hypothetical protein
MRWHLALALTLSLSAAGCERSESLFGPGLELQIRAQGAQLQRGELGADQGGPAVTQIRRPQPEVARGDATVHFGGRLGADGVALHLHADGDPHHWVLPAKGFDFVVSDELQWSTILEFSHAIQSDIVGVNLQAADAEGRLGPVATTVFNILPDVPPARLLVSLGWDAPVDLDLHVRTPDGIVVGAKNINSYEPPVGSAPVPGEWMEGGYLDFDSNQECVLDLRNRENILWLNSDPPPGRYQVYAHLFSACGQSAVSFIAVVQVNGDVIARAASTLYDFDARIHPVEGEIPGLFMIEFEIP